MEAVHNAGRDPLVPAPPERGCRDRFVGDPVIGAAEDQDLDEFVEDHTIRRSVGGGSRAGWATGPEGRRAENWSQMGSMMDDETAGTGSLLHTESLKTFPYD